MTFDPLTPDVLELLGKATGLSDKEAWTNIWLLVSKSEHDNTDPKKAFLTDEGDSLFTYASALSYDAKKRGVTIGIVGWTTANDGKDGQGDAPELFEQYKQLGGDDLAPYIDGCTRSKEKREKLIAKIKTLKDDPKWSQAQFQNLVTGGGYLAQTIKAWKKVGISTPSALAIATVFDASLNQGFNGEHGGCTHLIKLGKDGATTENDILKKYNAWRRKVAGTSQYNEPPSNGKNRADQFEDLRKANCFTLKNCDKIINQAIAWEMK